MRWRARETVRWGRWGTKEPGLHPEGSKEPLRMQ